MKKWTYKTWLVISLCLVFVSIIMAGCIQCDWGRVDIQEVSIQTSVGTLTGYLLIPEYDEGEVLPAVVTSHGYLNNLEMQDCNYIELARNGYVVFAMNAYGHGDSSVVDSSDSDTIYAQSGGMVDAVEYLYGLSFVDTDNIGVTGHSMGGGYANTTMQYYSQLEYDALDAGATAEEAHALNKVASGVIIGNFPLNLTYDGAQGYLCDLAIIAGLYDEFYFGMTGGVDAIDIMDSETLATVVEVQTGLTLSTIEEDTLYTNSDNGYTFAIYMEAQFHATNHFSTAVVDNMVNQFNQTIGDGSEALTQVWMWKEIFNFVGLVGMFMFIVPFTKLLMNIPFFASINKSADIQPLPALEGKVKKKYWITNVSNSLIAMLFIVPFMGLGYLLLINPVWPQDTTGGIGLWAAMCGLISLMFFKINNGKFKGRRKELGINIGWGNWGKTLLLAVSVVTATYSLVFIADYVFKVDFRLWTWVARVFTFDKLLVAIRYMPLFGVFYVLNSLCVSRTNFENWSELRQIGMAVLFNVLGTVIFVAITYIPTLWLGTTLWGASSSAIIQMVGALIPILCIPIIPTLAVAAFINVKLYRSTGNIWLGGLINTILITLMTVANTSFSYAY